MIACQYWPSLLGLPGRLCFAVCIAGVCESTSSSTVFSRHPEPNIEVSWSELWSQIIIVSYVLMLKLMCCFFLIIVNLCIGIQGARLISEFAQGMSAFSVPQCDTLIQ